MMMMGGWVRDYGLFTTLFLFLADVLSLMDERRKTKSMNESQPQNHVGR